jgi:hypothetical protein
MNKEKNEASFKGEPLFDLFKKICYNIIIENIKVKEVNNYAYGNLHLL